MADQSKRVEFRSGNREGFILLPPEGKLVVRDRSTDVDGVTITKDAILGPDGTPVGGGFNPPWTEIELDPQLFTAYAPGYLRPAWRWIEPLSVVEVRGGLIANNNLQGNDLIVKLPREYAPPLSIDFVVTSIWGTVNQITIDSDGNLFFLRSQQLGETWHLGSWIRWNVPAS